MTYKEFVELANSPGPLMLLFVVTFLATWGVLSIWNRIHDR